MPVGGACLWQRTLHLPDFSPLHDRMHCITIMIIVCFSTTDAHSHSSVGLYTLISLMSPILFTLFTLQCHDLVLHALHIKVIEVGAHIPVMLGPYATYYTTLQALAAM